jgi:hypothetical protein
MQVLSLVWGILALIGMLIGFVPCLGALNWLNIPFAGVGAIVSGVALGTSKESGRGASLAGLVCCGIALVFGMIRLAMGGGIL